CVRERYGGYGSTIEYFFDYW
nr:immunoglobulin heavy chain junction region [Macaca mulatta]